MRLLSVLIFCSLASAMQVSYEGGILTVLVDKVSSRCKVSLTTHGINLGGGKPISGVFTRSFSQVEPALDGTRILVKAKIDCGDITTREKRVDVGGGSLTKEQFLLELRKNVLEESIFLEETFTGFEQPVDLQTSGRTMFVVEQTGKIKKIRNNEVSVFLDISSKVAQGGERGLLGLALHPDFKENKYIFVNYTRLSDGATVISRFKGSKEKQLLVVPQPYSNHNGGGLAFGPDGYLYISLGDGGSGGDPLGNGQNRETLLGKILRIDVDTNRKYLIPRSNPYVNNKQGYKKEIYAYGLRNPWKISFSGKKLFAADVGQRTKEEVNIIKRGKNYGWKLKEGTTCYKAETCDYRGLVDPIYEYDRDIGRSITGGYVVKKYNKLKGAYIFGDFVSGRIFALERALGSWRGVELLDTDRYISSFGLGPNGELYVLDYFGGSILKVIER